MKKRIIFYFIIICWSPLSGQIEIDSIYRNSYKVFELQRLPNGMYRDSKLFSGTDYHPISISNTGMGLVSLCIADAMGWISNAQELALETLRSVNGYDQVFSPDRTSNGYFRHFMNITTGEQMWNSEYSTIDTAILMSGAFFSMKYFQNDSITQHALDLWDSIDFEAAISNSVTGDIFLSMNEDGTGVVNSLTSPYSEYMIVAWLAKNASESSNSAASELWANFYSSPDFLPKVNYDGYELLSDNSSSFLSSFTHQFNYYLCSYFTNSENYIEYFENSQKADFSWWNSFNENQYEWGLGAGSAISSSYQANAINNNIDTIISPQIIAGYLPVNQDSENDLITLWNNNRGKFSLPSGQSILWRYSKNDTSWQPNEVIGIDYSTMLFGISTLPQYLGNSFFVTNNDFFDNFTAGISNFNLKSKILIYPNPTNDILKISSLNPIQNYVIYDILGNEIQKGNVDENKEINIQNFTHSIYIIQFDKGPQLKFIVNSN